MGRKSSCGALEGHFHGCCWQLVAGARLYSRNCVCLLRHQLIFWHKYLCRHKIYSPSPDRADKIYSIRKYTGLFSVYSGINRENKLYTNNGSHPLPYLTISESQFWVLLVVTNKNHGQPFVQYADRRKPFLMEASYHPKEVQLKKGSRETIMSLF